MPYVQGEPIHGGGTLDSDGTWQHPAEGVCVLRLAALPALFASLGVCGIRRA
jgi:hypothetical protein